MSEQQKNKPVAIRLFDKIRSSLVLKLNLHMAFTLISAFITINVILFLITAGSSMYKIESDIQQLSEIIDTPEGVVLQSHYAEQGYQVTINGNTNAASYRLPYFFHAFLPIEARNVERSLLFPEKDIGTGLIDWIQQTSYNIYIPINGQPYLFSYDIGEDLLQIIVYAIILLAVECLLLMHYIIKGTSSIRKTLQPISEMAKTTKALNAQMTSPGGVDGIQNLTGAISRIDAKQLDMRISVDDSQKELKDLAMSINLMLNRINAAYQSQMRFVSDASHELRTPISVIQGYANLLDRWGKNDAKMLQESIDAIKDETDNMKTLVEQLLFLARGDNESLQLQLESFDICDLVEEIIRDAQVIDTSHTFLKQFDQSVLITADRHLMKQAIRILLDNSIKYTPANETISLKIQHDDYHVKIIVQDNGIGIAPEDLPHIFDRFYRSDESRARKTGGSGLGLSIAKWIVERHNGHFEVLSRVDIGTRTTIVLPAPTKTNHQ